MRARRDGNRRFSRNPEGEADAAPKTGSIFFNRGINKTLRHLTGKAKTMSIAYRISGANRKRKYALFQREFPIHETTTVLDVGYADDEYSETDNYLERHYPHPHNITALGVVEPKKFHQRYPQVNTVVYDGKVFPFTDKQFDICWSNAVIEHVGDRDRQLLFLREIKRVSRSAYITTPNRHFPVEVQRASRCCICSCPSLRSTVS